MYRVPGYATILLLGIVLAGCGDGSQLQTSNQTTPGISADVDLSRAAAVQTLSDDILTLAAAQDATGQLVQATLLSNGDFEDGVTDWGTCGAGGTATSANTVSGAQALQLTNDCIFQAVLVAPEENLTLSCYGISLDTSNWSGIGATFSNQQILTKIFETN